MDDLFPYDTVRDKQHEMKQAVEQVVKDKEHLVVHAPTGLGKTAATIPQALSYALENDNTVFFLTSRHSQHTIALETLREIREKHNTKFTSADLIGKRHLCQAERIGYNEDGDSCPREDKTYTDNHQLTKLAQRRVSHLKNEIMPAEKMPNHCTKVCPYEIATHIAAQADIVIGDYFHIFHPGVRDAIFSKGNQTLSDSIIIVDEAHNLPDRTRSLHSATLSDTMIEQALKEARDLGMYTEEELLERISQEVDTLVQEELGMEREITIDKDTFMDRIKNIQEYDSIIDDINAVAEEAAEQDEESTCADIATFLDRWKGDDHGFVRVIKRDQHSSGTTIRISYRCLNPQYATKDPIAASHTTIAMSGTLKPLSMYNDILGFNPDKTETLEFDSPFPKENRITLAVDKVTTQYKERTDEMHQKIAWYILKTIQEVPGNTGVFFPSYKMRDTIHDQLEERLDRPQFLEDRRMDKGDKEQFLDQFESKTDQGSVLFGVIGGSFGEGIDYPGDLMNCAIIVGVPLQRPTLETQALIDFYEEKFGNGWDYAYNYPAVNRAVQAAGRCIRSKDDRGVIIYMDKRFTWNKYRKPLPDQPQITKAPWNDVSAFFDHST